MMLASVEKEKASSCKRSRTSEHLFWSHLQMHVTWRLCGKCLTCAALASSCSLGPFEGLCSKCQRQRAQAFPAQPTVANGASLIFVLCVGEEVSRPCSWVTEWFKIPSSTLTSRVSTAGVSAFPCQLALGKYCAQIGACFSLGYILVQRVTLWFQQPTFVPSVGLRPSHLALNFPWSLSPSSSQNSFIYFYLFILIIYLF